MWFAVRHVRSGRTRFALFAALVALVSALVLLLTGLGLGLGNASIAGLQRLPANAMLEQNGVRLFLGRSLVDLAAVDRAAEITGVTRAEPLGVFTVSVRGASGSTTAGAAADDAALFGVRPGSPLLPAGSESMNASTVVADSSLHDAGYNVGDSIRVEPSKRSLTIGAFVEAGTYSHLPVVYLPLRTWQEIRFGPVDGVGDIPSSAYRQVSAGALQLASGITPAEVQTSLADDALTVMSASTAAASTPGYKEETGTVSLMVFFLYVIGALLVATFFWNATVQRTGEFAIMRAIGASRGRLVREHLAEVSMIAVTGLMAAVGLSTGIAALLPDGVPFVLPATTVLSTSVLLFLVALLGGALSLRRVVKVDPLLALGRTM